MLASDAEASHSKAQPCTSSIDGAARSTTSDFAGTRGLYSRPPTPSLREAVENSNLARGLRVPCRLSHNVRTHERTGQRGLGLLTFEDLLAAKVAIQMGLINP